MPPPHGGVPRVGWGGRAGEGSPQLGDMGPGCARWKRETEAQATGGPATPIVGARRWGIMPGTQQVRGSWGGGGGVYIFGGGGVPTPLPQAQPLLTLGPLQEHPAQPSLTKTFIGWQQEPPLPAPPSTGPRDPPLHPQPKGVGEEGTSQPLLGGGGGTPKPPSTWSQALCQPPTPGPSSPTLIAPRPQGRLYDK